VFKNLGLTRTRRQWSGDGRPCCCIWLLKMPTSSVRNSFVRLVQKLMVSCKVTIDISSKTVRFKKPPEGDGTEETTQRKLSKVLNRAPSPTAEPLNCFCTWLGLTCSQAIHRCLASFCIAAQA